LIDLFFIGYLFYTDMFIFYWRAQKNLVYITSLYIAVILNKKLSIYLQEKKYIHIKNKLNEKEILQMYVIEEIEALAEEKDSVFSCL
jgi:hypothetical protein